MTSVATRRTSASLPSNPPPPDHEEGLLRDVLDELDKERKKRAELEAQLRSLLAENRQAEEEEFRISRKHYVALQTELQGYRQLVDVMTRDKPAIAAALKSTMRQKIGAKIGKPETPSLPLHVVRLLEIMPWDPRTKQYAFATEEMYEWQFFDKKQSGWASELRHCPNFFRTLPLEEPSPGANAVSDGKDNQRERTLLNFLAGTEVMSSAPPSQCVFTDHGLTKLYNIKHGYPLPENGGTWVWVGGWRVEKRIAMDDDHYSKLGSARMKAVQPKVDSDDNGWSYAKEPTHFLINPAEMCWDHPGMESQKGTTTTVERPVRRRKWTRQRALVEYPHASSQTKEFLSLLAQHACATIAANKVSEQLVDTKMALTESETKLEECRDELALHQHMLKQALEANDACSNSASDSGEVGSTTLNGHKDLLKLLSFSVRDKFLSSPV